MCTYSMYKPHYRAPGIIVALDGSLAGQAGLVTGRSSSKEEGLTIPSNVGPRKLRLRDLVMGLLLIFLLIVLLLSR